jgi:hypothetical protein
VGSAEYDGWSAGGCDGLAGPPVVSGTQLIDAGVCGNVLDRAAEGAGIRANIGAYVLDDRDRVVAMWRSLGA